MLEIWAFLTRQKVVYLMDRDGEVTKTVAKMTPFGMVAKRYWPYNTHNVILLDGGDVIGGYVKKWKPTNGSDSDAV